MSASLCFLGEWFSFVVISQKGQPVDRDLELNKEALIKRETRTQSNEKPKHSLWTEETASAFIMKESDNGGNCSQL